MENELVEVEPTEGEQKVKDKAREAQVQKVWLSRLKKEKKAHDKFRTVGRKVEKIFNADGDDIYVPLYWQVVNVQHVGVYSAQPIVDVRPRNEIDNPVMKEISRMIQRGLTYCVNDESFDDAMNRGVDDYLAQALGVMRIKIESVIEEIKIGYDFFNQPVMEEEVKDQTLRWEYVPWARFGWMPCNSWKHCEWIYFRHRMTRAQIREKFKKTVSASKDPNDPVDKNAGTNDTYDIYEVWDKKRKKVLFIAEGETYPLTVIDDPLELLGFYPMPAPMMMNLPSEEMIPKPDYMYIAHYDNELNRLQERRMSLLEQIKSTGAYDKGLPELKGMLELEDGELLAVQNLVGRMSAAGGSAEFIFWTPIKEKVETLIQLTSQIQFVKGQVDAILGIADIVMGTTKASETLGAQEIKGRWVGVRLTRKRECVMYTVREMLKIMAQLFGSHITPDNLQRMTQMQMTEEMMQIFQNDTLMDFVIDIETDSTVAKDEAKERVTQQEMLNGVSQFAQAVMPMVQQKALPADVASAILRSALRPYARYDKTLDEALNSMPTTMQQMGEMTQQMQQTQQQLQQVTGQMQQWQDLAQKLQLESTQAKSMKEMADAQKKGAETVKIMADVKDANIKPIKTAAEVGKIEAETNQIKSGGSYGGNYAQR